MSLYITGKSPYGAMDRLAKAADASYSAFLKKANDVTSKIPVGLSPGDAIKIKEASSNAMLAMDASAATTKMLLEMEQKKREALQEIPV